MTLRSTESDIHLNSIKYIELIMATKDDQSDLKGDNLEMSTIDVRDSKPTEKGIEWQIEQKRSMFRAAMTSWRRQAVKIENLLSATQDISLIKHQRKALEENMIEVSSSYEQLNDRYRSAECEYSKYEGVENDHYLIVRKIACEYVPGQRPQNTWIYSPITSGNVNAGEPPNRVDYVSQQQICELTRSFAEQVSLSRLPVPEPTIFNGDPLKFPGWSSFDTLIDQKGIPSNERIHYLKRYLTGAALEAIEGYFLLSTDDAYVEARMLLEQRYGDPFVIANAFRDKLEEWPKIPPKDGLALRKF